MGGLYPINYDEVVTCFCAHSCQGAMKGLLESLYFNIVWVPIKALRGIKPIGVG